MTDPLTHTWSFAYDGLNDLAAVADPLGKTTKLAYDGSGNLLSVSQPISGSSQAVTSLTYDPANPGDVITVKDPSIFMTHTAICSPSAAAPLRTLFSSPESTRMLRVGWCT
jgi:YD repeat-containing protein